MNENMPSTSSAVDLSNIQIIEDDYVKKSTRKNDIINDEKRLNIIEALNSGVVTRKLASKTFNVKYNTICCIYRNHCLENIDHKKKTGGNKPKKFNEDEINFIKNLLYNDCTLSLKKIKEAIFDKFNITVSLPTIHKCIDNFGYSFKRVSRVAAVSLSDELRQHRIRYATWFLKEHNTDRKIMFYDETGFQVVMRNTYGRSLKGKKAICAVPSIKSRNITVMAIMSADGLASYEVLQTPCNRAHLVSYFEKFILELTNSNLENIIIIMDNASFHKCIEFKDLIVSAHHQLEFLPPYSPFFNPIENMFSQWKKIVRNLSPKNELELMTAIGSFKNLINPEQCHNYYRHIVNNCIDSINGKDVFDN